MSDRTYTVHHDREQVLAHELANLIERFAVVGYHASGSSSVHKNVWFVQDMHHEPNLATSIPYTEYKDAQRARADQILDALFKTFGEVVDVTENEDRE